VGCLALRAGRGRNERQYRARLELGWPIIGDFAARYVIGPQFIEAIAGRTLHRIRELAEAGSR